MAKEIPQRSEVEDENPSVSTSKATAPAARALRIQVSSSARSRTQEYAEVSMAGASGSVGPRTGCGVGAPPSRASVTRRARVRNSSRSRNSPSTFGSGSASASSSTGCGSGVSQSSCTSWRERRIWSAKSISVWRRLSCLISPALASNVSRSPYSLISAEAVLTPMPGAPGTLSTLSPHSACTSTTRSGPTPNFSITCSRPMRTFFMVSNIVTWSPTSCIRSLSEETITTSPPASRTLQA